MPPPSRPGPMHAASAGPPMLAPAPGSSPPGPGMMPGHSHGAIPLFPTPVGPGMGPPPNAGPSIPPRHLSPPSFMDPSPMYGAHPHANAPGQMSAQGMGQMQAHRPRGSFEYIGQRPGSPAMGSLQRPPSARFDERDRDRDRDMRVPRAPPSALGAPAGSALSSTITSMNMGHPASSGARAGPQTQMLTGPGAVGMNLIGVKEREGQRERERLEREARAGNVGVVGEPPGGRRDWEREREQREWERDRDRARELEFRLTHGHMDGMIVSDADTEREWLRQSQQNQASQWSRFAQPRPVPGEDERERERERERAMMLEMERERGRGRERGRYIDFEDARMREAREVEADTEKTERLPRAPQRGRTTAKEKERVREDRRICRSGGAAEELAEERERLTRQRSGQWMEIDFEKEREREQRESDAVRSSRQNQTQIPHHHHHLHQHRASSLSGSSAQGNVPSSKSSKAGSATGVLPGAPPSVGPSIIPPDIPPFGSVIQDRQQPGLFRQGASRLTNGPSHPPSLVATPSHQPLLIHPPHPLSHQHSHPNIAALGFPHRRTPPPPPFSHLPVSTSAPPGSSLYAHARSPTPVIPRAPSEPPLHIGMYIYPRIPFPYIDFPNLSYEPNSHGMPLEREPREIHTTIFIPYGFIPTQRPAHPRVWGGAEVRSLYPISPPASQLAHAFPFHHRRFEDRGVRRVYTDDSDLFLCALHAGFITWSGAQRARSERRDLRLDLKLTKEARFVGGYGAAYRKRKRTIESMLEDSENDDDGSTLRSSGWGNSHDGAGIEIMVAEFVEVSVS
ncbi:hypothetical protein BKA93DRAFT_352242 [Sparassis latifolia]